MSEKGKNILTLREQYVKEQRAENIEETKRRPMCVLNVGSKKSVGNEAKEDIGRIM